MDIFGDGYMCMWIWLYGYIDQWIYGYIDGYMTRWIN